MCSSNRKEEYYVMRDLHGCMKTIAAEKTVIGNAVRSFALCVSL